MKEKRFWFLGFTAVFAVLVGFVFWGTWSTDFAPVMPDCPIVYGPGYAMGTLRGMFVSGKFVPADLCKFLGSPYFWHAVGTTSCRTLESAAQKYGEVTACTEDTGIFIYPGYEFKAIDGLITNFHLPESTLIMLVSAFMGRERTLAAYETAIREKYRFFSFGDSMMII